MATDASITGSPTHAPSSAINPPSIVADDVNAMDLQVQSLARRVGILARASQLMLAENMPAFNEPFEPAYARNCDNADIIAEMIGEIVTTLADVGEAVELAGMGVENGRTRDARVTA